MGWLQMNSISSDDLHIHISYYYNNNCTCTKHPESIRARAKSKSFYHIVHREQMSHNNYNCVAT